MGKSFLLVTFRNSNATKFDFSLRSGFSLVFRGCCSNNTFSVVQEWQGASTIPMGSTLCTSPGVVNALRIFNELSLHELFAMLIPFGKDTSRYISLGIADDFRDLRVLPTHSDVKQCCTSSPLKQFEYFPPKTGPLGCSYLVKNIVLAWLLQILVSSCCVTADRARGRGQGSSCRRCGAGRGSGRCIRRRLHPHQER